MKNFIIIFSALFLSFQYSGAQHIRIEKTGLGTVFYQNNRLLSMSDLTNVVKKNDEAYSLIKKAKNNNVISQVIGGIGGFTIGWQLGAALAGSQMNYKFLALGVGIILVSIPVSIKSRKQTQKAVDIYNSELPQSYKYKFTPNVNLFVKDIGIGIMLKF